MSHWVWLSAGLLLGADWLRRSVQAVIGMRKLQDVTGPEWDHPLQSATAHTVAVVVPARNESAQIERCLRSLLDQDYPKLEICAVDDRSTDATGAIMDRLEEEQSRKLRVLHVDELPPGWLGKTHAMWSGARDTQSDWILFTDGDVIFRSDALRRTLAYAESTGCDHLVIFPTLVMKTFGERMMLGFFGLGSSLILRAWKVRDPKAKDYIGAGAFNLIRRSAYERLGTYQALSMEVIDDLKLGQAVKQHGFKQDCVVGRGLVTLRWAEGAFGVVENLRKNMFSLLRFNWTLAVLVALGATIYHLAPWVGLIVAPAVAKVGFAVALFSIVLLYVGIGQRFDVSPWYVFTQPLAAIMFVLTLMNSALSSLLHGGVMWRGTTYSIREIKELSKERSRK